MPITEATIRNLASSQSFLRGEDYYHSGAVYDMQKRGNILMAEVAGSSYEPYQVTIELTDEDDIISTDCTCPYDWGGALQAYRRRAAGLPARARSSDRTDSRSNNSWPIWVKLNYGTC